MKYGRFEELPVWQAGIELAVQVYELTAKPEFKSRYSLRDQIERAAVSVSNNVAEGFERGTTQELLTFLYIARGSAGEGRSMLCLLERIPVFAGLKSEISNLKSPAESIARQLRAWADSLQDSEIKGQRYLTDKTRKTDQTKRDRETFLKELEEIRRSGPANSGVEQAWSAKSGGQVKSPSAGVPQTKVANSGAQQVKSGNSGIEPVDRAKSGVQQARGTSPKVH